MYRTVAGVDRSLMLKPLLLLLLHAIEQRTLVSTQKHHNDCLWELEPNVISQKRKKEEPALAPHGVSTVSALHWLRERAEAKETHYLQ